MKLPWTKRSMRGKGWLKDPDDPRDMPYYMTPRTPEPPASVDLSQHVTEILDQGDTGSCVAHAYAYAIQVAESQARLPYDPISREYLYFNARAITGDERSDVGTYLRSGAKALQVMGAAPESAWPFTPGKTLNKAPGIQAHMLAHPRRNGTYQRIMGRGAARCNSIRRALEAGHAVVFGAELPERFMTFDGTGAVSIPTSADAIIGGHALCITEYEPGVFGGPNSWGDSWGDAGFWRMTSEYIGSEFCSDFWLVLAWDRIKQATQGQEAVA